MAPNAVPTTENTTEPVVAETYDEVVFTDPSESFFRQLQRISVVPPVESSQRAHQQEFSDADDFLALIEAQKFLQTEIATVKERFQQVTQDLSQVEADLAKATTEGKTNKPSASSSSSTKPSRGGGGTNTHGTNKTSAPRNPTTVAGTTSTSTNAPPNKKSKT